MPTEETSTARDELSEKFEEFVDMKAKLLDNHDVETDQEADKIKMDFFEAVVTQCINLGGEVAVNNLENGSTTRKITMVDYLYEIVKESDKFWKRAMDALLHNHGIEVFRFTLVMFIKTENCSMKHGNNEIDFSKELGEAVNRYLDDLEKTEDLFHEKEIEAALDKADSNDLREFFELLKEIKVFNRNPDLYDSDEDRVKHQRMLKIYNRIMSTNPN